MTVVIIPAFNEAKTIADVVKSILPLVDKIIVVDDGSSDATGSRAQAAGAIVLKHIVNRGYGAALVTGTDYALTNGAQYLVHFDADGQFEAKEIERLLEPLKVGATQVTLGSRFLGKAHNLHWLRRAMIKLATIFTWAWSGVKLTDAHNGFRAFTAAAASQMKLRHNGMAVSSEIVDEIARLKLGYREVPVTVHYTDYSLYKGQPLSGKWQIIRDLVIGKFINK
ncbi:MAG: Glycosyl transferase, family 2 [Parcubacteria group bacterium GW2011_GWA2_46_39]|nr:MAG: Glycosyl transferase, family 2 [Parcubacteria group bacterium GW2011_GWA2_46_39]